MTEIGVGTTQPARAAARRPGTVGQPLPTVRDARRRRRAVGRRPERLRRLPSASPRRHASPSWPTPATRWFKTGDTVTRDDDGYFRILGRTSVDILKSGGYKLSALEIEEVLREHAAVAEVAVVGVPDETWGERVVACVVPRPGREDECAEDALRGFAQERLAPTRCRGRWC